MKRILIALLLIATAASAQIGSGFKGRGGNASVSSMLPITADSTLWHLQGADTLVTDGALPIKVSGIRVSGTTRIDGTLTLITTASESLIIGAGGFRNEGGLRQKGLSQFGATATPVYITADGKVGIGTATSSPYNALGLVSSTSGRGTGIGLTSAQWNKNRTNWVTASDTSAIGLYIDSLGGPRFFMKGPPETTPDTLGLYMDGGAVYLKSSVGFNINAASITLGTPNVNVAELSLSGILPVSSDSRSLGSATKLYQNGYFSDGLYLGGKGQTATQYISKENTIAGQDSSMMMRIGSDGNSYVRYTAADGDSAIIHVRSDSTEIYSKNAIVFDAPAVLLGASNVGISKMDTVFTAGYVPRWVKFTSGAKSWYSPVYADTTGKW
jgi:hypothetical protein